MPKLFRASLVGALALLVAGTWSGLHAQQTGVVTGLVQDQASGRPLPGAQVVVDNTTLGAVTNDQGRFLLTNVPAGSQTVRVVSLGYETQTQAVTVEAGRTATVNFRLTQTALQIGEIVVTGVAGATPQAKMPFTVSQLRAEDLPVPAVSAASAVQGKVAGATVVQGSGRPGSAPSILLRGPTSINASNRSQEPLFIVDGVILGASMVDIDALDIESIEVVKGAAAASLYGSRAAHGVVQIMTRRGTRIADDQVRYTVRSEYGQSQIEGSFNLAQQHRFAMDGNQFVRVTGATCEDFATCPGALRLAGQMALPGQSPNTWNTIQSQSWPGTTYDQVDRFFTDGAFNQNYVAAEGRTGATNFNISFTNQRDGGVMPYQDGLRRNAFRVNVDQSVRPNITLSASAYYSRSNADQFPESQGNPIFNLTRMPAGVDLMRRDPNCVTNPATCQLGDDEMIVRPDPFNENDNPLYQLRYREWEENRGRFLGSTNLRVSPLSWLDIDGNVSYDRLQLDQQDFYPRGFRTARPNAAINNGFIWRAHERTEALNASVTASVRRMFFDEALSTRTQFRYLVERNDYEWSTVQGSRMSVADVPTVGVTDPTSRTGTSGLQREVADGYFALTNLDFYDRYIVDLLVRNDGSSLFGPDERRNWYYRAAAAWRLSEEPWFTLPAIDEMKLRYSLGTAGSRPHWSAQYETYSVSGGAITPVALGNRSLRPEFSREHEFGLDVIFGGRYNLVATYATVRTEDQILPVPQPAYAGFSTRWENAGTLASNTIELSLDTRILDRPDMGWSARINFDRTRQHIAELNVPAFTGGVAGQNLGAVFYYRAPERLGTFYGTKFAQSCADLPQTLPSGVSCSDFAVNDEGLLVWVGAAGSPTAGWNTYTSGGTERHFWGTLAPFTLNGEPIFWGAPFAAWTWDPTFEVETTFQELGNTLPDYSIGLSSNFSWRNFALYGLLHAEQGFSVYNQPLQWATFQSYAGIIDQGHLPEQQRKPVGYYDLLYGVTGLNPSSRFVEDGSFVKLREVSLSYRITEDMLSSIGLRGFSGATLSAVGRNLLTFTNYDGYDPEVGRAGGTTGSAALARVDGYNYPNFRTFTFGVEVNF
ncbi:MAG TPA: SusC/RagA family TonB-linked outer membrane protein [Longimicrobiales bacterium]|nr:SusC/RagA family TonB-linked outer membrane protein [Longimicrobiales bacterium]